MSAKITPVQLVARINDDPAMFALGLLPIDSFARHVYQTKSYPCIRGAYTAANADREDCEQWRLTPEEWLEQMTVVVLALAHDMKLDLMRKGLSEAV